MGKKLIFSLFVLIFLIQVTSAVDTEITVKTLPNHNVNINFLNPSPEEGDILFESFNKNSGESGNISFVFSFNEPKFDITAFVMESTEKIIYERFDNNTAGESLYLILFPGGSEIIRNLEAVTNQTLEENSTINETLEENSTIGEVEESEQEKDSKLTGSVIFWEGESFPKRATYYGIGIIVLSLVGFLCIKLLKRKKKEPELQKPEKKQDEKKEVKNDKELIEDAEKKIKEAQEDIRKIKNEDKIKEAKKKIIEDEKELMRLREGKD